MGREKVEKLLASKLPSPEAGSSSSSPSPGEGSEAPSARCLDHLKQSDKAIRDILWRKMEGSVKWSTFVRFLTRLGCRIFSLNGSKKKVVDEHTGRTSIFHRPHPGDECRRDQLDRYRSQLEEQLHICYEDVVSPDEWIHYGQVFGTFTVSFSGIEIRNASLESE